MNTLDLSVFCNQDLVVNTLNISVFCKGMLKAQWKQGRKTEKQMDKNDGSRWYLSGFPQTNDLGCKFEVFLSKLDE